MKNVTATIENVKYEVMYNNEFMCAAFDNECDAKDYIAEMPDANLGLYTIKIATI